MAVKSQPGEGPTWLLLVAIYLGFGLTTWYFHDLPWWAALALGGWFVCWHSQLQHEALHGHPTRHAGLNALLVMPSLWLWLPYPIYRESHLRHHDTPALTDPADDPESFYVTQAAWARAAWPTRALLWSLQTLAGRLLLGPWVMAWRFLRAEAVLLARGDRSHLGAWLPHLLAMAALFTWLVAVCGISVVDYVLYFAWPGTALALMRSFAEHRPAVNQAERTVVVERGGPFGWLYLHNNLHALHHQQPGLAWHALPARYRAVRERLGAENGGFVYGGGYAEIARRYLLRPKDSPVHPGY